MGKCEVTGGEDKQQLSISCGGGESSKRTEKAVTAADGGGDILYHLFVKDKKKYLVGSKAKQNGGMSSTGSPVTLMGVGQKGPPLVTRDDVDAGPMKKFKIPKKEPKVGSHFDRVPATVKNTYSRMTPKEKDGKSSVKNGDTHKDAKSMSGGDFYQTFKTAAAAQAKNGKQSDKDKQTLKKISFLPEISFEKKMKTGVKENDKKEERCHVAKVNPSLGRSGSNTLVKGMEGGRSVVGGSLKRVSTETVGMSGQSGGTKRAKLERERSASGGSITRKGKQRKKKNILVSKKPRKTVRWRVGENIEDVRVFEFTEQEQEDIAEKRRYKEIFLLASKVFGPFHKYKGWRKFYRGCGLQRV